LIAPGRNSFAYRLVQFRLGALPIGIERSAVGVQLLLLDGDAFRQVA
jgi:hypothetical protein